MHLVYVKDEDIVHAFREKRISFLLDVFMFGRRGNHQKGSCVRQFGFYLGCAKELRKLLLCTRGPEVFNLWCTGCSAMSSARKLR
jgi:hypothetical protein